MGAQAPARLGAKRQNLVVTTKNIIRPCAHFVGLARDMSCYQFRITRRAVVTLGDEMFGGLSSKSARKGAKNGAMHA